MKEIKMNKNSNSGRSMIEMLGVLAIIGVLSVGGISGYSKAMLQYKVNKTIEQITHTAATIKTTYMQQPKTHLDCYEEQGGQFCDPVGKYFELNPATVITIGAASDEMVSTSGSSLQNVFGGEIDIEGYVFTPSDLVLGIPGGAFSIRYDGIPKNACISLATYNWTGIFQGIYVGNKSNIYGSGEGLIIAEYCDHPDSYPFGKGMMGSVSCNGEAITLSPADAVLGCSCEDNLCSIAFITE